MGAVAGGSLPQAVCSVLGPKGEVAQEGKHEVSGAPQCQPALTNREDDGQDPHALWLLLVPSASHVTLAWVKKRIK